MDKERELNALADVLLILTKELVENPTFAIKDAFKYVHREFVTETLASEAAYYDFSNRTGKDIRSYDWYGGKIKCKDGQIININSEYTAEHMQTGKQFKKELIDAYKSDTLSKEFIKEKLKNRYLCWVTKDEDKKLKILGYNSDRPDPIKAYQDAGIVIYVNNSQCDVALSSSKKMIQQKNPLVLESKHDRSKMIKSRIGEMMVFTNERIALKTNQLAYAVYNNLGKRIGYVFECLDSRTPAYRNAELCFFDKYKNKKYCRFTSLGERVGWIYLRERIDKEEKVTIYID